MVKVDQIYTAVVNACRNDVEVPRPNPNESAGVYLERLAHVDNIAEFIIIKNEVESAVPSKQDQAKSDAWNGKSQILEKLLERLQSGKVLFIQGVDGVIHQKFDFNQIKSKILEISQDYSLAIALGNIIELETSSLGDISEVVIDAIMKNLILLNERGTLFNEGVHNYLVNDCSLPADKLIKVTNICDTITDRYCNDGIKKQAQIDKDLIANIKRIPGLNIYSYANTSKEAGVVITTSSGGGCHKNIANGRMLACKDEKINCAIINETEMTQDDLLLGFIGIAKSNVYPIVFQTCGQQKCRELLSKIDEELCLNYIPKSKFALLRSAMIECEKYFPVKAVYSTQHYAHDLRVIPRTADMLFQVCDYNTTGKLHKLASLVGKLEVNNSQIRFLIPARSCITPKKVIGEYTKYFEEQLSEDTNPLFFEKSIYPTAIQNTDESNELFSKFTSKNDLYPPDEKDVSRYSIVMGGVGCKDLIEKYLKKILSEVRALKNNDKFEIIVACGSNKDLKDELEQKYPSFGNVKIKICGFIDNRELISYNRNAVLITKPGGGTISECVQNNIATLVHYDDKHWWERGNCEYICQKELGVVVDLDKSLLKQAETLNDKKKRRQSEQSRDFNIMLKEAQFFIEKALKSRKNPIVDRKFIDELIEIKALLAQMHEQSSPSTKISLDNLFEIKKIFSQWPEERKGNYKTLEGLLSSDKGKPTVERMIRKKIGKE